MVAHSSLTSFSPCHFHFVSSSKNLNHSICSRPHARNRTSNIEQPHLSLETWHLTQYHRMLRPRLPPTSFSLPSTLRSVTITRRNDGGLTTKYCSMISRLIGLQYDFWWWCSITKWRNHYTTHTFHRFPRLHFVLISNETRFIPWRWVPLSIREYLWYHSEAKQPN